MSLRGVPRTLTLRECGIRMKKEIRQEIHQRLGQLDPISRYARSLAACKHLTRQGEFIRADVVMIFLSLPDEIDTAGLALAAWQMSKTVVAPKVEWAHRKMTPIEIHSLETGMAEGPHGLIEPADGQPIPVNMIDLIVTPGAAFDRKGNRLGRGGGFYDRFLALPERRAVTCGLAFREQIFDDLSPEDHDQPVDMVVTDEEVLRFGQ